ncbi:hypothetical protein Cgig2_030606 [Carnegiea gigantea]|uniref:Uncharacterized protein n=1 Tax=Carnegiea gigantea TaxID=171969 RepID=A0A9Q1JIQ9_9CARY|nr:hypothetical protein Cgig2_030606 [Carnegiea gigantea]
MAETQLDRMATEFSLSTSLSPAKRLIFLDSNSLNNLPTDSNATLDTASDGSSILAPILRHQAETLSSKLTLFSQSVTRSSLARIHPRVSIIRRGVEAGSDLLVGDGDEGGEEVRGDGGEEGDGSGGDVRVGEVEIGFDAGGDGVPEVGSQAGGGADQVEGELLADGGGRGGHDLLHGGAGNHGGVPSGGGLLEGLQKGAGLPEGVGSSRTEGMILTVADRQQERKSVRWRNNDGLRGICHNPQADFDANDVDDVVQVEDSLDSSYMAGTDMGEENSHNEIKESESAYENEKGGNGTSSPLVSLEKDKAKYQPFAKFTRVNLSLPLGENGRRSAAIRPAKIELKMK